MYAFPTFVLLIQNSKFLISHHITLRKILHALNLFTNPFLNKKYLHIKKNILNLVAANFVMRY